MHEAETGREYWTPVMQASTKDDVEMRAQASETRWAFYSLMVSSLRSLEPMIIGGHESRSNSNTPHYLIELS